MSTNAQAVLEQIRALPPEERQIVFDELAQLQARQRAWEEQMAKLREIQARHAGRGLLNRLLEERAKERARVAATAKRLDALLVHKDPEFSTVSGVIKQRMLPPKTAQSASGAS